MRGAGRAVAALAFTIRWIPAGRDNPSPAVNAPIRTASLAKQLPSPAVATTAKITTKIDRPNPFIPAQSNGCRAVETFAMASILIIGTAVCVVVAILRLCVE